MTGGASSAHSRQRESRCVPAFAGTSGSRAQPRRRRAGRRLRRRALLARRKPACRRRSSSRERLGLRRARRAAAALRHRGDACAACHADRTLRAAAGDRARRQFPRRRRAGANARHQPRRAQGAAMRPRLALDRRQSRSGSGRKYRRPLCRSFGDRSADIPPRAFGRCLATAKSPVTCIRWRGWRGAAAP